jgi:hypothetical protein
VFHRIAKRVSQAEFDKQHKAFLEAIEKMGKNHREWAELVYAGRNLVQSIMGSVDVPKRYIKAFERAAKAFLRARSTRDVYKWVARNKKNIELLIDANEWPFIGEMKVEDGGTPRLFPVADFDVHNLLGLSEDELLPIKVMIAKAFHTLRRSKVKGIREVLYGDVHLVGKLAGNALAWYNLNNDTIYVRPFASKKKDAVHSMMHEIGHRFWRKKAPADRKNAWLRHHWAVDARFAKPGAVEYPVVGQEIAIAKERGRGKNRRKPVVQRIEGTPGSGEAKFYIDERRFYTDQQFWRMAQKEAQWSKFPTPYAASDPEEHFCEALAMFARGTLADDHAKVFENIFGGGQIKMGDRILRSKLAKLAHDEPELRSHLVPLLRTRNQKQAAFVDRALSQALEPITPFVNDFKRFKDELEKFLDEWFYWFEDDLTLKAKGKDEAWEIEATWKVDWNEFAKEMTKRAPARDKKVFLEQFRELLGDKKVRTPLLKAMGDGVYDHEGQGHGEYPWEDVLGGDDVVKALKPHGGPPEVVWKNPDDTHSALYVHTSGGPDIKDGTKGSVTVTFAVSVEHERDRYDDEDRYDDYDGPPPGYGDGEDHLVPYGIPDAEYNNPRYEGRW